MMKKILAIMLGAALVLSMAGAVAATGTLTGAEGEDGEVLVKFTLSDVYTVIIPDDLSLTSRTGGTATVTVDDMVIAANSALYVGVKSTGGWNLQLKDSTEDTTKVAYTMSAKRADNQEQINLIDTASSTADSTNYIDIIQAKMPSTSKASTTLTFGIATTTSITTTGEYSDTLTFKVSVGSTTVGT